MSNDSRITISIVCITYNHEKYIRRCLEGFLIQKTNFSLEVIINDDASTDKTVEIINEYASRFTNFTLFTNKENAYSKVGIARVLVDYTINKAKGTYIAICEGDDYWTDPYKLQKQVDFLEKNIDYVICTHGIQNVDANFSKLDIFNKPGTYNRYQVIQNYPISTLSVVFRNNFSIPEWYYQSKPADYNFFLLLLEKGLLYSMNEIMGVHILHEGGIWSLKDKRYKSEIIFENYNLLLKNLKMSEKEYFLIESHLKKQEKYRNYLYNPFRSIITGKISLTYYLRNKINEINSK